MVRVFKHCYMLINSVEGRPSILWFLLFSTRLRGPMKGTFKGKSTHVKK
jgi:hypothetical protein